MAIETEACSYPDGVYIWWDNLTDYTHARTPNSSAVQPDLTNLDKAIFIDAAWTSVTWVKDEVVDLTGLYPKKVRYHIEQAAHNEAINITYSFLNEDNSPAEDQDVNISTPYGVIPEFIHV